MNSLDACGVRMDVPNLMVLGWLWIILMVVVPRLLEVVTLDMIAQTKTKWGLNRNPSRCKMEWRGPHMLKLLV